MEKIVISDTNIFIDLLNVDLIEEFFQLPWEIHTTEPILLELKREGQYEAVKNFQNRKLLTLDTFTANEVLEIVQLKRAHESHTNLSFQDCSVWYSAKKQKYVILSGDGQLRKNAQKDGIEVRGIIYILDKLLEKDLLNKEKAVMKIQELYQSNNRLPKDEIQKRIVLWGDNEKKSYGMND